MSQLPEGHRDFIIVGGGIVGLTVAHEIRRRYPSATIAILEKEQKLGMHASGRNSGVLHSGIYYDHQTIKAKVCVEGARRMKEFAAEHGINCVHSGKVIVGTSAKDLPVIDRLMENARQNGIRAERVNEQEIKKIEPHAGIYQQGIFCVDTAVIDIKGVLAKLHELLTADGVEVHLATPVLSIDPASRKIMTPNRNFSYGYLFNCAGASADRIAAFYGLGLDYSLVPFKGIYFQVRPEKAHLVRSNIYPVPDINLPFLGVHLTRVASGEVYAGPTAIPALGRENYGILEGARLGESVDVCKSIVGMYLANCQNFRNHVHLEIGKYFRKNFFKAIVSLMPELREEDLASSAKVGIRPQLVHTKEKRLQMDYLIERSSNSLHVLNAISPAFTSSFAFAEWIVDKSQAL